MKKLFVFCVFIVTFAAVCPAAQIFETFGTDVIADTTDDWTYSKGSSSNGLISYTAGSGVVGDNGQYIHCELQRNNGGVSKAVWLTLALPSTYSGTDPIPESWFEFDYRELSGSTGRAHSIIGLVDSASSLDTMRTSYNSVVLSEQDHNKWNPELVYNDSANAYVESRSAGTAASATWPLNQAYRIKAHFYYAGNGDLVLDVSTYSLGGVSGNDETLVVSNSTAVVVPDNGSFLTGVDTIVIGNRSESYHNSYNYFDIDNLYFSTVGSNANTVAPFVIPEPATIAILALGGFLFARRKR